MSANNGGRPGPRRTRCCVDARFGHFFVTGDAETGRGGLVSSDGVRVLLRLPLGAPVSLTVELCQDAPAGVRDGYEDVVECGYRAVHAEPAVLGWSKELVAELGPLPSGPGDYRLRYHVHAGVADGDGRALLQLWAAPLGTPAELKIAGRLGSFWHPFSDAVS